MIFWGMVVPDTGVATIGYPKAMLATIGLWLVIFPVARKGGPKGGGGAKFRFRKSFGDEVKQKIEDSSSGRASSRSETLSDDEIDVTSSFNGINRKITSQNFRGGKVNTNFGGVQLDMRSAAISGGEARLDIRAFIGGVEIRVPSSWEVDENVSTTIGGVQDERDDTGPKGADAPKLVLTGSATLGGISIKD